MNIIEWIEGSLNMRLFPVQNFVLKLAYGIPFSPDVRIKFEHPITGTKYDFSEAEYLDFLTREGRCNYTDRGHTGSFFLALGRRAGKTTFMGVTVMNAIRELIAMDDPQTRFGLPAGNHIGIMSFAMDLDQAQILRKEYESIAVRDETLRAHLVTQQKTRLGFATPRARRDGREGASIDLRIKSCGAKGLRGTSNYFIGMDEFAFYRDQKDVYQAAVPSLACFSPKEGVRSTGPCEGRAFTASTPNGNSDYFYEQFHSPYNTSIRIPTWEMNPTLPRDYYAAMFKQDPAAFWVEHGAEFSRLRS